MRISSSGFFILVLLFISVAKVFGQQKVTPYYPSKQQIEEAYIRQNNIDSLLKIIPLNTSLNPNWQPDGAFWYVKRLSGDGQEYYYVNGAKKISETAFNPKRLVESIKAVTGKNIDPLKLNISKMFFNNDKSSVTFKTHAAWLQCDLNTYQSKVTTDTTFTRYDNAKPLQAKAYRWGGAARDSLSPDKKWIAYSKGGNVFIKEVSSKNELQLTKDGSLDKPYGDFSWSPDSKNMIVYLIDPKKVKEVYYVLSSVPGTTRGQLKSREYQQPGDEMTSFTPFILGIDGQKKIKVDAEKIDFFGAPKLHWRDGSSRYFTYEKVDRGHQRFRVIEVDVTNGNTRNIIDEKTSTFIYEQRIYTRYLSATHEIIWITEKDGWRHIYNVNDISGSEKLITKGNWVVKDIDSVDTKKREIWFTANGVDPAEDPYFVHYYRIGFDGKNRVDLTPALGNHRVVFSPDRKYYLDTYSQVNMPPVVELHETLNGKIVLQVDKGNTQALLATGVKLPEIFVAKARDSKTDIWGVVYRPSNFDQTKSYPIIENIYAGPQDSFVPKNFSPVNEMQSIAELGFIVVQIDGMGTANRSKAFHDVCWKNLADAGFADRILWMKALATKYPQADTTRVGVYGTSAGGQNSAGAVLFHPEFYKAAVSACGCHDNRIDKQWWNEQWMGYPVGPHYEQQSNITNAGKLKGNLLLIVGEADENVPPESTYRFADALIKNNKNFDFLVVPGMGHSDGGPYGRRKKRDFFVTHLLHANPPQRDLGEH
ncbi:MAG: DPP IV N-terminal domain-containing protein [Mucilaginibacter sp.]|uniref:S9 family peptidase n=1 Tax=Mucilaginibacter sp. TaxID=1882438 RepID=UPI0032631FE7